MSQSVMSNQQRKFRQNRQNRQIGNQIFCRNLSNLSIFVGRVVSYEENRKLTMYGLAGLAKKDVLMNFKSYMKKQEISF